MKTSDEIGEYYDDITDTYIQHGLKVIQAAMRGKTESEHIRYYYDFMSPPRHSHILDAGCGIGAMSFGFSQIDPSLRFTGVTVSKKQVQLVNRVSNFLKNKNITGLHKSYQDTGLDENSLDGAMFFESIGYADLVNTFKEMYRIIKPGGFVFIKDWVILENASQSELDGSAHYEEEWYYRIGKYSSLLNAASKHNFAVEKAELTNSGDLNWDRFRNFAATKEHKENHVFVNKSGAYKVIEIILRKKM